MATKWQPVPLTEKRSWLLTNGEVVTMPDLEETPSGLKVRVAGSNQSVFRKDLEELIVSTVRKTAQGRGTEVWMPLYEQGQRVAGVVNATTNGKPPTLHLGTSEDTTLIWFRFRHATLPIEAVLHITAGRLPGVPSWRPDERVQARLGMPVNSDGMDSEVLGIEDERFTALAGNLPHHSRLTFVEFVRDNPVEWASILGTSAFRNEREMVEMLLEKVRKADSLARIQVPDLREPSQPAWLDLELHDTNLTMRLIADLQDYLDGEPALAEAARLYNEFRAALRKAGVVLQESWTENDLNRALNGGDEEGFTVRVMEPVEKGGREDSDHSLFIHMPTGTFVVNCLLHTANRNEVADEWEKAHVIAELTGQEDALLAYAREFARTKDERRTREILAERKNGAK